MVRLINPEEEVCYLWEDCYVDREVKGPGFGSCAVMSDSGGAAVAG